ncbi:3',5'-cyclic-nucleotide phosphodiesterase [Podila epigama]|nr:3',5'-cyclic-nucleotide phosphodiesterase [Podila epigama]
MTTPTFESALAFMEEVPYDTRPILLLVDVDPVRDASPHLPNGVSHDHNHLRTPNGIPFPERASQHSGQRHARAASENTASTKGQASRSRRSHAKAKPPSVLNCDTNLTSIQFLETVLQSLAKGCYGHIVPVAICSALTQEKTLELFNMGVADVLIKPIEDQVARTLFLNAHRYSKYRTAVTIPRYASQKNTLALPSHARLRDVFLKDQWLSDILIHHYCPPPTKISIVDFPSMSSHAAAERVAMLKKRLLSWDFHPHDLCQDDLMRCVVIVIQEVMKLDGLGDLNIPEHLLHRFVIGLRDSYHRSNPYHNFAHAVDVLQATFYFLCRMGKLPESGYGYPPLPAGSGTVADPEEEAAESVSTHQRTNIPTNTNNPDTFKPIQIQDFLRPEDIFALIVASIGHDVGHPGVNNMFLFRKMVVSTILATDMGLHFDYVGKIKEQTERLRIRNTPEGSIPKPNQASIDEQERLVLCGTLIKCADISNASRPFHVAERWSAVLLQEMCNQADIEKEMAISSGAQPVPTGPTKNLANDQGMQIDSQLGFIHGFAMPLFSSVKEMIPEMDYCVELLQINHKIWEERKTEYLKNGGSSLTSLLNVIPTNHSNSLSGPKPATQAKRSHGRSRTHTSKSLPKDGLGRQSKATTESGNEASGRDNNNSEGNTIARSQSGHNNTRRPPSSTNSGKPIESGAAAMSSIPRPRPRTKAMTSEGSVVHSAYGQSGQEPHGTSGRGNVGHNRFSGRDEGSANTRIRSVTSAQPLPVSVDGPKIPSGRQTPGSKSMNSRGQKSPGRRNGQSLNQHQSQSQHHNHHQTHHSKQEVTVLIAGSHVDGLGPMDKVEPIVLGSLLPVAGVPALDPHSGSDTSSSIPSSPSLPTSSPSTSPSTKNDHRTKTLTQPQRHSPPLVPLS